MGTTLILSALCVDGHHEGSDPKYECAGQVRRGNGPSHVCECACHEPKPAETVTKWRCQTCGILQATMPELESVAGPGWRQGRCTNLGCKSRRPSKTMTDMAMFKREERPVR